jgi:cysteine desulfurase/selenocysteine lyase
MLGGLIMDNGQWLSNKDLARARSSFYYLDSNPDGTERIFFENAGGSLRLKAAEDAFHEIDSIPDCDGRKHAMAIYLKDIVKKGEDDVRILFNVKGGTIATAQTASQLMYNMVSSVIENASGSNVVTSILEHPSSFDAAESFSQRTGKELRIVKSNPLTGGVIPEDVCALVDKNTCLLNIMYASNLTGAIMDIPTIVKMARKIKPDIYITVDAVQHAPHSIMDFSDLDIDGVNFAPYKFFGTRGLGVAYLSERLAKLPHPKLIQKPEDYWGLGSDSPAQYIVITKILDYVCSFADEQVRRNRRKAFECGMKKLILQERALLNTMLEGTEEEPGLRKIPGVTVYADNADLTTRDLIVAIGFDNIKPADATKEYVKRGIVVFDRIDSSMYSARMLHSFGLTGVVRVSPLHCHTKEEVLQFLKVTQEIAQL